MNQLFEVAVKLLDGSGLYLYQGLDTFKLNIGNYLIRIKDEISSEFYWES